jgi:hypothetical protein
MNTGRIANSHKINEYISIFHALIGFKLQITVYRTANLAQPAVDITPLNGKGFFWSNGKQSLDEVENEFALKKVKVRGMFDYQKEVQVEKSKNGEKGV